MTPVEPFTLNQAIMSGMLFILGLLIGMFLLAGGKWKRRYRNEVGRREALETENETLRRDAREMESLRHAAVSHPAPAMDRHAAAPVAAQVESDQTPVGSSAYRKVTPTNDGAPDVIIRRP